MAKSMPEADKYKGVILKKIRMTHTEVINRLTQKDIEISRGQSVR